MQVGRHRVDKVGGIGTGRMHPDLGMHLVGPGGVFPQGLGHHLDDRLGGQFESENVGAGEEQSFDGLHVLPDSRGAECREKMVETVSSEGKLHAGVICRGRVGSGRAASCD